MIEPKKPLPAQQPAQARFRPVYPSGWALAGHLDYVSKMHEKSETERATQQKNK